MEVVKNLDSGKVFECFEAISKIPRGTGNEKGVSDFLVKFAKDRGFDVWQDEALNVKIHKPATAGYENAPTVIIQGHMDMVCEKEAGSDHDFEKDPIKLIYEDGYLTADGTTLGADNGIAVAYGMAILDSDDIPHPPLEMLFTTAEEVGMKGAIACTGEHLSGKMLLNIDAEEEGVFFVSCAGGSIIEAEMEMKNEPCDLAGIEIDIRGLRGGHSGMNIIDQRANAIKLAGRLLSEARKTASVRVREFEIGSKHNAIPRHGKIVFGLEKSKAGEVAESLETLVSLIKREFAVEDPSIDIKVSAVSDIKEAASAEKTDNLIDFILLTPDGVFTMSKDIDGLVQSSSNMGVMVLENGTIKMIGHIRSASNSEMTAAEDVAVLAAKRCGWKFEITDRLAQWEYEPDSPLRDLCGKVYKELTGNEAKFDAIHAGLECGLLKNPLPETDMISFGPSLSNVHSPEEKADIQSVDNMWKFIKELLKEIK